MSSPEGFSLGEEICVASSYNNLISRKSNRKTSFLLSAEQLLILYLRRPHPEHPESLPVKISNNPPYSLYHDPMSAKVTARDLEYRGAQGMVLPPRYKMITNYFGTLHIFIFGLTF